MKNQTDHSKFEPVLLRRGLRVQGTDWCNKSVKQMIRNLFRFSYNIMVAAQGVPVIQRRVNWQAASCAVVCSDCYRKVGLLGPGGATWSTLAKTPQITYTRCI